MKILIVDQFSSGISLDALQKHPVKFDALVEEMLARPHRFGHKTEVREVPDDTVPTAEYTTTVLCADSNGNAIPWAYNWDSSG